jgi:hypothetical protein
MILKSITKNEIRRLLNRSPCERSDIGDNKFLVAFLRVQRKLGTRFSVDLAGGALFAGKLSIENTNGDKLGSDKYDPSPFLALTLAGKF